MLEYAVQTLFFGLIAYMLYTMFTTEPSTTKPKTKKKATKKKTVKRKTTKKN